MDTLQSNFKSCLLSNTSVFVCLAFNFTDLYFLSA